MNIERGRLRPSPFQPGPSSIKVLSPVVLITRNRCMLYHHPNHQHHQPTIGTSTVLSILYLRMPVKHPRDSPASIPQSNYLYKHP